MELARGTSLRFTSNPAYDGGPRWSPDSTRIAFFSARDGRWLRTQFDENFGQFAPDGKWITYQSDESGRYEIYVRPLRPDGSPGGGKWQISTNGGVEPRWPRAGKEIFYIAPDNMLMAVEVRTGTTFEVSVPRALFPTRPVGVLRYDAASDGQRFLVAVPTEETTSAPATVVLNWFEELKRRVPSK